ncbi:NAD-dependent protein deacylase [Facklamia sp. DSM 111018]|uniref:protein acetyllysine N-acetyltransferase n=1 Tax=Facklamia lactis TaxID=2749967 RepID=A0ABS0LNC0_9LACT|nr:NAD-dependent protein deacylase [Facklamia lactis]MBG9979665.1 NAD-dependent protein deacylase [Facklamia lactis]MBG9985655.1 NAD-dependent protein deacylase [Facklamia lactis]
MAVDLVKVQEFARAIQESHKIVFFGGAGVSTASGIPDFRSADGIFLQETGTQYSAEQMISRSFYEQFPSLFFDFYFDKLVYPEVEPSLSHSFLVDLERKGKDVSVVTQNIDGLHQKAGSQQVYELHGSVLNNYCSQCHAFYSLEELEKDPEGIPRCPVDGAIVKPDVVLYEEQLDQATIMMAIQAISQAEMMIIAGTSLNVYPAASFIQYFKGRYLVVINKTSLQVMYPNVLVFEHPIEEVFAEVADILN